MGTRIEPKAENLVRLIESKVRVVEPFNSDCELRFCRTRFPQESLGKFSEVRGILPSQVSFVFTNDVNVC